MAIPKCFDIWVIHPARTNFFNLCSENLKITLNDTTHEIKLYLWEIFTENIIDSWRRAGPELPARHRAQAYLIVIDPTNPNSLKQVSSIYQQLVEIQEHLTNRSPLLISVMITNGDLVDAAHAAYKKQLEENIQKLTVLCQRSGALCFKVSGLWKDDVKAVAHEIFAVEVPAPTSAPTHAVAAVTPEPGIFLKTAAIKPISLELEALYPELAGKILSDNAEFSFTHYPPSAEVVLARSAAATSGLPGPQFYPTPRAAVVVSDTVPAVTEEEFDEPIPPEFLCGITFGLMIDPVITVSGQSYNRDALTRWVNEKHSHPVTSAQLEVSQFIVNLALRDTIAAWRTRHLIPAKTLMLQL